MKRSFFLVMALVAASRFVLPLFAQPARASGSIILRGTPSIDHYSGHAARLPSYHGWVDGKLVWYIIPDAPDLTETRKLGVAKLDGYVFEGGPDFYQRRLHEVGAGIFPPESFNPRTVRYSLSVRFNSIAGVWGAPMAAPDGERPYAPNRYSLLIMKVPPAENAPRITDFAVITVQGARPAGYTANYPNVIPLIRL